MYKYIKINIFLGFALRLTFAFHLGFSSSIPAEALNISLTCCR